jgi:uncharacterized protein (TIGR01777 family)
MRVLVSGAGGLIGSAIVDALRARGDEVGALRRGGGPIGGLDVRWDPASGELDASALAAGSFDAIVHLAGESVLGRWTNEKRSAILSSRVEGTGLIAKAIARLERPPKVFACASATGFYGNRGDELLTEESAQGSDFLAGVVGDWERAADPARDAGIRTTHIRMAAVFSPNGGALKAQLGPARLGLNGKTGSGQQWAAWIGLHDLVRIWLYVLDHDEVDGVINAVGPTPARNVDTVKALGSVLHRPVFLPAPVPLMKLALGSQLVDEVMLTSQKVVPARLEGLGFEFDDRTIEAALRRELAPA